MVGQAIRLPRPARPTKGKSKVEKSKGKSQKCFDSCWLIAFGRSAPIAAATRTVERVLGVHLMEFGIPEAMWHLGINNFAAIVTMDAHGNSLHANVEKETGEALSALAR